MIEHEHRRKRIHRKARAVHIWLLPAAVILPVTWLYFSYGICQETDSPALLEACGALGGSPLVPVAVGAALLAWLAWDLAKLGAATAGAEKTRWKHAHHGYHALEHEHKGHVRLAIWMIVTVSVVLAFAVAYLAYYTTH